MATAPAFPTAPSTSAGAPHVEGANGQSNDGLSTGARAETKLLWQARRLKNPQERVVARSRRMTASAPAHVLRLNCCGRHAASRIPRAGCGAQQAHDGPSTGARAEAKLLWQARRLKNPQERVVARSRRLTASAPAHVLRLNCCGRHAASRILKSGLWRAADE